MLSAACPCLLATERDESLAEGSEHNATLLAEVDKRVKRRLLMGNLMLLWLPMGATSQYNVLLETALCFTGCFFYLYLQNDHRVGNAVDFHKPVFADKFSVKLLLGHKQYKQIHSDQQNKHLISLCQSV